MAILAVLQMKLYKSRKERMEFITIPPSASRSKMTGVRATASRTKKKIRVFGLADRTSCVRQHPVH